jgi:hypothetical protein
MSALTLTADMPIQLGGAIALRLARGERIVIVASLPQAMFDEAAERQCQRNHDQALEVIRRRCGFSADEALSVIAGLPEFVGEDAAHRILYVMRALFNRGGLLSRQEQHSGDAAFSAAAQRLLLAQRGSEIYDEAGDVALSSIYSSDEPFAWEQLIVAGQAAFPTLFSGDPLPLPPVDGERCWICGCTDDNACPGGCSWAGPDLCSNPECVKRAKDLLATGRKRLGDREEMADG